MVVGEGIGVEASQRDRVGGPSFRDLVVWQQAITLAKAVYEATASWPSQEQFGLTNQARRAAASISANIAEGQGRGMPNEFRQFLRIAYASLCELESRLELGRQLGSLDHQEHLVLITSSTSVARMLHGLMRSLPSNHQRPATNNQEQPTKNQQLTTNNKQPGCQRR